MSNEFECPNCRTLHDIEHNELWDVYTDDSQPKAWDCPNCSAPLLLEARATSWQFSCEINKDALE